MIVAKTSQSPGCEHFFWTLGRNSLARARAKGPLERSASAEGPVHFTAIRVRNGNVDSRSHGQLEKHCLWSGHPLVDLLSI